MQAGRFEEQQMPTSNRTQNAPTVIDLCQPPRLNVAKTAIGELRIVGAYYGPIYTREGNYLNLNRRLHRNRVGQVNLSR